MYFEIENTPEHIKKARRTKTAPEEPIEEFPRLVLAPFSRPPQVVFDNVVVGSTAQRHLEIINPTKNVQQITIGRALPPGLIIHLPDEWLVLEPETCYCLTLQWMASQPTALRETIRFTNEKRGRYDVIVVLKTLSTQLKKNKAKSFKTSPGRIKKKAVLKKSPVSINKRKAQVIYQETKVRQTSVKHNVYKYSNKENVSTVYNNYTLDSQSEKCPFDSPCSFFDTSEVFSNMKSNKLQATYDKVDNTSNINTNSYVIRENILTPSNKQFTDRDVDVFDNLKFTPLKSIPQKNENLEQGPKIIISMESDSFNNSLDSDKENVTHSIIYIPATKGSNKWSSTTGANYMTQNIKYVDDDISNKKVPNTSSPKELESLNFTMNTDFSRISNDLSFLPQRFSTERKNAYKPTNENFNDLINDNENKLGSDTYTKSDSPNLFPSMEYNLVNQLPPKNLKSRQSLFKDYPHMRDGCDRNYYLNRPESMWRPDRSPPKSMTPPPLHAILEETSSQCSETMLLDKRDQMATFTINRTFNKPDEKSFTTKAVESWSKKSVRCEPELWKIPIAPPKKSMNAKEKTKRRETINKTVNFNTSHQNFSLYQGDVYCQSFTVDPFLSSTYFYDEEAVEKFESEFKRWMNYILTPPADLDSNVEHKIDFGKAWIENRNKEVPAAPTKEQVSSKYHNSHRLDSLRRSARTLLQSPEISPVLQKLNMQIEKKLIAIRNDRNLHLDVGLQKIIMELLLSYNPLWLRIGLEAIYGLVIPLKSNSDVEGLTTFIIQRMFKNPLLKNKTSKSSAPNMLLPAYLDAIKKFTLKKFFMLVFFLDRAKEKKLISHDPCLFCRNAVCKESRDILLKFTRELIAGIGDITKHLRPLGYIVCHKQSYLDEYKYAVHNIAVDIRDGVRLTKVMEIISLKNGLLKQLRTPAISRLQKVHNVQVALNALKEANYVIVGDISAQDIADGHREKTLSLLWQIIHVFRAPLFEKAANVIQGWWRKKYEVIIEQRKIENEILQRKNIAASVIQCWWRRIQYNRLVELQTQQFTAATIILQKYCRMWIHKRRMQQLKNSTLKIEKWYHSVKEMREAMRTLANLKTERVMLYNKSATIIQTVIRKWLCVRRFKITVQKIICVQSIIRRFTVRSQYIKLKKSVAFVQEKYRAKLLMKEEHAKYNKIKRSAITIQSYFKMYVARKQFLQLKSVVKTIENNYKALIQMRVARKEYLYLKQTVIMMQSLYRTKIVRMEYLRKKQLIMSLQRKVKAYFSMKKERSQYIQKKNAISVLQKHIRAYHQMREAHCEYLRMRQAVVLIQKHFKSYLQMKAERQSYLEKKKAAILIQKYYRNILTMRKQRSEYVRLRNSAVVIQQRFKSYKMMKANQQQYNKLRKTAVIIQQRFRALIEMKKERIKYIEVRKACIKIQINFRAYLMGKCERKNFLQKKNAVVLIQSWYRNQNRTKLAQHEYEQIKQASKTIQTHYRAYKMGKKQRNEYVQMKKSITIIQNYYRLYKETKIIRERYIKLRTAAITLQTAYRAHTDAKRQRNLYLQLRESTITIQTYYRQYRETVRIRQSYCELRRVTIYIQTVYKSILIMRRERCHYLKIKNATTTIQQYYRAAVMMKNDKVKYQNLRSATIAVQRRFRALTLKRQDRAKYLQIRFATIKIQNAFRAHILRRNERINYLHIRKAIITIQRKYRDYKKMQLVRHQYLQMKTSAILIQRRFRFITKMKEIQMHNAARRIQIWYRSVLTRNMVMSEYTKKRNSAITIQSFFRMYRIRNHYLRMRFAANCIQRFYRSSKLMQFDRIKYLNTQRSIITLQSHIRRFINRRRFLRIITAVQTIQRLYKWKKMRELLKLEAEKRRQRAAISLQSHIRTYLAVSQYRKYRQHVIYIQKLWRSKLLTRLQRCDFLQKKRIITKLQTVIRGHLIRKQYEMKKEIWRKDQEAKKVYWAASKIQALFRGHMARNRFAHNSRIVELRRRWRDGALQSTQMTMKERNEEVLDVLSNMYDIERVIRAFKSLELLTEVYPMMYHDNVDSVVSNVYVYMSVTNRSISSVEVLKSAASVLVNLTRYSHTAPQVYERERILIVLKFMWRFSNSETQLFCVMCTYLWLFSKYDKICQDLTKFLHIGDNHKILVSIKTNVDRMKRMTINSCKKKPSVSQNKVNANHTLNYSLRRRKTSNSSTLPALEPDYGIVRVDKPRYFEDPHQAIEQLFKVYKL